MPPRFVLGFLEYANRNPQVGNPLEDEHGLGQNFNAQETSEGVLLFRKLANDIVFIPNDLRFNVLPSPPGVAPHVDWIASPNFWAGRAADPIAIVIHTMAGTLAGTDSWFANPASQVSAHFGVGLDGRMHQYVRLEDGAWANGILEPGNRWPPEFGPGNPNIRTVSIETEDNGNGAQPVTDLQYGGVLAVARLALERFPSITHLVGHNVISPGSRANCPGDRWVAKGRFADLARDLGGLTALP